MKARVVALLAVFSSLGAAQAVLIRVIQDNLLTPVANGGAYTVNAAGPGQARKFTVDIMYVGTTKLSFTQIPQLVGSPDFRITRPPSASTLGPNQSLTMELEYLPSNGAGAQTELDYPAVEQVSQDTSAARMIVLVFTGTAPDFSLSYKFDVDANTVNLPAGGVLPFIDTSLTAATLATVAVVNRGTGTGQVVSATATGDAFSLASVPLLPAFVQSGGTLQFQVRYRPRQIGADTGSLTVTFGGGATYTVTLTGHGISSYFNYEIVPPAGEAVPVVPNAAIPVPATPAGDTSIVTVRMKNTSAFDIGVNSIAVSGTGYQLKDVPFLPLTLGPGDVQTFSLVFTPQTTGEVKGKLRVGGDSFDLSGMGLAFPDCTIEGPSTVQPLDQPSIGVTLASPQPVTLKGTLRLSVEAESFAADPAVLFSTGGKTADFTVPAGTTKAVFANGATSVKLQVGTVAGTIVITPAFATEAGLNLPSESPSSLRMTLSAAAPRLLTLGITGRSINAFTLQMTGLTTTRSLTSLKVTFKARSGYNFTSADLTQDLTATSTGWFNSQTSTAFGGQFVVQLPFSMSSGDAGDTTLLQALESATVTLANEKGDSNSLTVNF